MRNICLILIEIYFSSMTNGISSFYRPFIYYTYSRGFLNVYGIKTYLNFILCHKEWKRYPVMS